MNLEKFKDRMASDISLTPEERKSTLNRSIKACNWKTKTTICMEELAELSQALSKQIRKCGDRYNLLEEMADVCICIEYMKMIFGIDETTLQKAIDVKIERERHRLK